MTYDVPDHGEHGQPDVCHVLGREPPVPDTQHVGHCLQNKSFFQQKKRIYEDTWSYKMLNEFLNTLNLKEKM